MPERGSKTSTVPVVWATFRIFSARSKWFPVAIRDHGRNWLYHYDPETKQQSMEWRNSGSPHPKNSESKHPLEKFLPRFFGIKTAPSSLIIFQRAKLSARSTTHLCWCNWRIFWRQNAAGRSAKGSCNTTEIGLSGLPMSWSSTLFPGSGPSTTCSLDWKNNWKVAIFLPTRRSLLPRRPGWTDNLLNFFWVACKS